MDNAFWHGKSVFLTGHTGFKGSWLSLWLTSMGARVTGYALPPPDGPNLYELARVEELTNSHIADIRDHDHLASTMHAARPEIVFHLAAQPLVLDSYRKPVETYSTNVMGTVYLLEAVRQCSSVRAVINVTTDKCYENREWPWGYRENDQLGGIDPYSNSKACSEMVTASYRSSFFNPSIYANHGVALASARAGNVIGGGDWAKNRLIPDFFRAIETGKKIVIRSPDSIRPWQHVLEPLCGYLLLAERLYSEGAAFAEAWNFGPSDEDARSVRWIVECLTSLQPGISWESDNSHLRHEAHYLKLDSSKARTLLGWDTQWNLKTALAKTLEWHRAWLLGTDMREFSTRQIASYGHQNSGSTDNLS